MIKNKKQYDTTKACMNDFEKTLAKLQERPGGEQSEFLKLERDSLQSVVDDLLNQLNEYENLKKGIVPVLDYSCIHGLSNTLIQSRIAHGMTQKDLAEQIGVHEQQIQRYEQTDYISASYERLLEVFDVFVSKK